MSVISFAPLTNLCFGSGKKPGWSSVVTCRRRSAKSGKEPEVTAVFLDGKKSELRVWREKKGITALRDAGKYSTRIVNTTCDGVFTAVFFHHDKGRRLGLAIMQHDQTNIAHLVSDPLDCSESLDAVLAPLVSNQEKGKATTALLVLHSSFLKQTNSGLVMSAVLSTRTGEVYVVIGAPFSNLWKRFRLEKSFGVPSCLCIYNERVISVMNCTVGLPVDHTIAVTAPTVELALSVFDQARLDGKHHKDESTTPSSMGTALRCVLVRESIFSLDDKDAIVQLCYQSQNFRFLAEEGGVQSEPSCHIFPDNEHQRYAIVVSLPTHSYIVHMRRSSLNMELISTCTKIASQSIIPHSVTWLQFEHPARPESGLQLVLVLSQDYHMYAAEVFGNVISVQIGEMDDIVCFIPPPKYRVQVEPVPEGSNDSTRLTRLSNEELICTNGLLGVLLLVTGITIDDGDSPHPPPILQLDMDKEGPERRIMTLIRCLQYMEKLSKSGGIDLLHLIMQRVLPVLQCTGSSQREVFLTQRMFQILLKIAAPKSVTEWKLMWCLTKFLQKTLSKRGRDSTMIYTDVFFVYLVGNYVIANGTSDEQEQATEGLLNVVSDELKSTWEEFMQKLDDKVSFVLDSLAERVSPVLLAEECVRHLIIVSTLSNGTNVVNVKANASHIVHTIAYVLLASCLDIPLYVCVAEIGRLECCVTPPTGGTTVFVPPHSFKNTATFEYALTLSTDLLCTAAPDTSLTPCASALLSMLVAKRYHVVSTFLQVFALHLAEYFASLNSLCDNVHLITSCSDAVSLTEATLFKKFVAEPSPSAILCVLCSGSIVNDYFNVPLWRQIGSILSEELRALIIVSVLYAMTDRLISAQNNYSASIIKLLLQDKPEDPLRDESVKVCRNRLKLLLNRLEQLWASVDGWSPYKVTSIASSVLASCAAMQNAEGEKPTLSNGSAVSRSYVVCFRMLSLIGYSYQTEEYILDMIEKADDGKSIVSAAFALLQAIERLNGTALPVESLQWRCVDLAAASVDICSHTPGLSGFLLEMLRLSEASQTNITALKQYYFSVVDRLGEVLKTDSGSAEYHNLQEQLVEEKKKYASSFSAAAISSKTANKFFILSKKAGAEVPEWPGDHNLPARRYLINTDWVDTMWPIEFIPQLIEDCLGKAQERVLRGNTSDASEEVEELSPPFSHALFHQLCTLSPPVRTHALLGPTEANIAVSRTPVQMSKVAEKSQKNLITETRIPSAPRQRGPLPVRKSISGPSPHLKVSDELLTTSSSLSLSSSSSSTSSTSMMMSSPPLQEGDTRAEACLPIQSNIPLKSKSHSRMKSSGVPQTAAFGANAVSSLYPPESVAWWETGDTTDEVARRQRILEETLGSIDVEISNSATSYTTATSEKWTQPLGRVRDEFRYSSHHAHHRCKKHGRSHYRCARHRNNGTHTYHRHSPLKSYYHDLRGDEVRHPSRKVLSVSPKKEVTTSVRLLQFNSKLQPPPLPPGLMNEGTKPSVQPYIIQETDDMIPPRLLSLQTKPHVSRVTLFGLGNVEGVQNVRDAGVNAPPPFLSSSSARPQALAPPALPSSSVFVEPPPMLRLNPPVSVNTAQQASVVPVKRGGNLQREDRRVVDNEEIRDSVFSTHQPQPQVYQPQPQPQVYQQQQPKPQPQVYQQPRAQPYQPQREQQLGETYFPGTIGPSVIQGTVGMVPSFLAYQGLSSVPPSNNGVNAYSQKEERPVVPEATKPQVSNVPPVAESIFSSSDGAARPVSALKEPVLSPSENVAFRMYVDELKMKGISNPVMSVPRTVESSSLPAPVLSAAPVQVRETNSEIQQQGVLLEAMKEMFAQHEEYQAKQFRGVIEAIRLSMQKIPTMEEGRAAANLQVQGLSATEQAELLRHTIHQKNRLMTMNQDLLDLQARIESHSYASSKKQDPHSVFSHPVSKTEEERTKVPPPVSFTVPVPLKTLPTAEKSDIAAVSTGVQLSTGAAKGENVSPIVSAVPLPLPKTTTTTTAALPLPTTTVTTTPPPPPPPPSSSTVTTEQVVDSKVTRNDGTTLVPDLPSTMSIDRTLSRLSQINAELLRANATTEDMERAIQESRGILQKHNSLGSMYSGALESSLMMNAARRRASALEQELSALNASSLKPQIYDNSRSIIAETRCEQPEREKPPYQPTFISSIVEDYTTEPAQERMPVNTSSPSKYHFTNEHVEYKDNSDHLSKSSSPPPVSSQLYSSQNRGTAGVPVEGHVFVSQVDERLGKDSSLVDDTSGTGSRKAQFYTSSRCSNTGKLITTPTNALTAKFGNEKETLLKPYTKVSPTRQPMDLAQLYTSALSSGGEQPVRKSLTPAKNRPRVHSPPQKVPEKFSMYMPASDLKKPRRAGSKSATSVVEPREGSAKNRVTMSTKITPVKRGSTKVPSSSRDSKRRETLALHTSKRLADLQRAFL
ncbi:hypothetical protein LSM04_002394 [Trypanosoma melophagium]|uniref:uncharacterized protein n=1 Tax=Trypanosoma melophagium TaxID=715481 RepID=UPI00351A643F|nr:hypothetical protein LSM04_002394 [Trypanosoma melophagium]